MSSEILQALIADGTVTVNELTDVMNLSRDALYRRTAGTELVYHELRTLIRRFPDARVAFAFLDDLLAGTGVIAMRSPASAGCDMDDDGDIDTDDLLAAAVAQVEAIGQRIGDVHRAIADGKVDEHEAGPLRHQCRAAIESLMIMLRQIDICTERTNKRTCRSRRGGVMMTSSGG